jgi:hypothetical protein
VSSVKDMAGNFSGAEKFNQDISGTPEPSQPPRGWSKLAA